MHTPSTIEAEEAEEIGVEHLLRDIRDVAVGTLSTRVTNQLQSLQGLHHRLGDIQTYLKKVLDGQLPVNHAILGNLQDVFNLLPNLSTKAAAAPAAAAANGTGAAPGGGSGEGDLAYAMSVKTNDQLMAIYLSSLIRAITAFHDLIENKIQNRQQQEEKDAAKKEAAAGGGSSGPDAAAAAGEGAKKDGHKKDDKPNGVNGEAKEGSDKEKK